MYDVIENEMVLLGQQINIKDFANFRFLNNFRFKIKVQNEIN